VGADDAVPAGKIVRRRGGRCQDDVRQLGGPPFFSRRTSNRSEHGDLVRLRNVRNAVTAPMRFDQTRGSTAGKVWLLSVPGETSARQVTVSQEVLVAARVVDALGADHALLAKDVAAVTIKGRVVHIDTPDEVRAREAATRLGRVEGITSVSVRAR
jgi:hypothetical protein